MAISCLVKLFTIVQYCVRARSIVHNNFTEDRAEIDYVAGWIKLSLCRIAVAHACLVVALRTSGACFNGEVKTIQTPSRHLFHILGGQQSQLGYIQSPLTFTVSRLNQEALLELLRLAGGDWTRKNRKARMWLLYISPLAWPFPFQLGSSSSVAFSRNQHPVYSQTNSCILHSIRTIRPG